MLFSIQKIVSLALLTIAVFFMASQKVAAQDLEGCSSLENQAFSLLEGTFQNLSKKGNGWTLISGERRMKVYWSICASSFSAEDSLGNQWEESIEFFLDEGSITQGTYVVEDLVNRHWYRRPAAFTYNLKTRILTLANGVKLQLIPPNKE